MRTAFIGHRLVNQNIYEKLIDAIENEIKNGCNCFIMGTHGEFDSLALRACRSLKRKYKDIKVEVVLSSLNTICKRYDEDYVPYKDVETVVFGVEDAYFKQRITLSNRHMIDECDTLICYVDKAVYKSGAKSALKYAEKRGLKIINLYTK